MGRWALEKTFLFSRKTTECSHKNIHFLRFSVLAQLDLNLKRSKIISDMTPNFIKVKLKRKKYVHRQNLYFKCIHWKFLQK